MIKKLLGIPQATCPEFEQIIDDIVKNLNKDSIENIKNVKAGGSSVGIFFGMAIRNKYNLWRDNEVTKSFKRTFGLCHADDFSMLIEDAVIAAIRNVDRETDEIIQKCKNHWISGNFDPATMEKLTNK